jgi:hypothetical protein
MSRLLQDVAYSLGVTAFKNGKMRVPAWDKTLAENCLKDCKVGEGTPYLKEWLKGWDDANLDRI